MWNRTYVPRLRTGELPWRPAEDSLTGLAPGTQLRVLSRDPADGAMTCLWRIPPGWSQALPFALAADAELFVLHNVTDIGGAAGFYVPHINIEKLEDEVIQAARDKVYAICHQAVGDSIDAAHRLVIRGGLIETLDKVIKDKKIELVVLPHNGDKGILSWLRGDYAERFMREAAIPFVVLPMDAS